MHEAAIGIVVTSHGKIVVTKRMDTPMWVLPGGGIDSGETPEEAVIREVLEETGLTVEVNRKCGEYFPTNKLTSKTHVFECRIASGELKKSEETEEVNTFFPNLLPHPFFLLHQAWLDDWQRNKDTLVVKPITQITYLAIIKFFFSHPIILVKFIINKKLKNLFAKIKR